MTNSIRIQRDRIVLEAEYVSALGGILQGVIPNLISEVKAALTSIDLSQTPIGQWLSSRDFSSKVSGIKYTDTAPIYVDVPRGFTGDYLSALAVIGPSVEHVAKARNEVYPSFAKFLGQLVNNPDAAKSTIDEKDNFKQLEIERQDLNKAWGELFAGKSSLEAVPYKQVVKRQSDWPSISAQLETYRKAIEKIDRSQLIKSAQTISDLLAAINRKIERKEFDEYVSSYVITHLANGAYQVASEFEFYSVTYFRLRELDLSITAAADKIDELFD